jgi:CheY-like chemotaxis protein
VNSTSQKIILCADDDPDDRELLCNTINEIEPTYKVIHAINGADALEQLKHLTESNQFPCLIILDMNMPIMGGKETLIELKKNSKWSAIPVVIFTTSPKYLYTDLAMQYNIEVVTKPSSYTTIVKEVSQLLSHCE